MHTTAVGDDGHLKPVRTVQVGRHVGAGCDGATLFVTTSREGLDPAALARQPHAGHVLCIDGLGVAGPPCTPYRGPVIPS